MANEEVVKAIQYIRNEDGEFVPVFPTTTADNVYMDVNNKVTVADALVGGKVSESVYSYKNIVPGVVSGIQTGMLKLELPMGMDEMEVSATLSISTARTNRHFIASDLIYNRWMPRDTSTDTMYTTVAEINQLGNCIFVATSNGVQTEWRFCSISGSFLSGISLDFDGIPIDAAFDALNKYMAILSTTHIYYYRYISGRYTLIGIYPRSSGEYASIDSIAFIDDGTDVYLVTATDADISSTVNIYKMTVTPENEVILTQGPLITPSYTEHGKLFTRDGNIFVRKDGDPIGGRATYTVDKITPRNASMTAYTTVYNLVQNTFCFSLGKQSNRFAYIDPADTNIVRVFEFSKTTLGGNLRVQAAMGGIQPTGLGVLNVDNVGYRSGDILILGGNPDVTKCGISRYYSNSGSNTSPNKLDHSKANNGTIDVDMIDAFVLPNGNYAYIITASNKYGLPIIPYSISTNDSAVRLGRNIQEAVQHTGIDDLSVSDDGTHIAYVDRETTTLNVYRRSLTGDTYSRVPITGTGYDSYAYIFQAAFVGNDRIVTYARETGSSVLDYGVFIYGAGTDSTPTGTKQAYKEIRDAAGELTTSPIYKDGSLYSVIICATVINVISTPVTGNASFLTVSGVTTLTGPGKAVICSNTIGNGFYWITANTISHYTVGIVGTTATITRTYMYNSTYTMDYNNAVLTNDDRCLIVKTTTAPYVVMYDWGIWISNSNVSAIVPTMDSALSASCVEFNYDRENNELVLIDNNQIVRYAFDRYTLTRIGAYGNVPQVDSSCLLAVSSSGNTVMSTTALGRNTIATSSSDGGLLVIHVNKTNRLLSYSITGKLDTGGWTNYNIYSASEMDSFVRLGYNPATGKACIIVGDENTTWLDGRVDIPSITYSGVGRKYHRDHTSSLDTNYYASGYTLSLIQNTTGLTHVTTPEIGTEPGALQRIKTPIVVIPPEYWIVNSEYGYVYKYYHNNINTSSTVNVNITDLQSLNAANIANMHSISLERTGYVEIYCAIKPTSPISVSFEIIN